MDEDGWMVVVEDDLSPLLSSLSIYLYPSLSLSFSFSLSIYPSIHLSIYPSIDLSVCLSIYLEILAREGGGRERGERMVMLEGDDV